MRCGSDPSSASAKTPLPAMVVPSGESAMS